MLDEWKQHGSTYEDWLDGRPDPDLDPEKREKLEETLRAMGMAVGKRFWRGIQDQFSRETRTEPMAGSTVEWLEAE